MKRPKEGENAADAIVALVNEVAQLAEEVRKTTAEEAGEDALTNL